uniref:Uncharacterized protein n=1 Tax=Oryza punctata TaxID=4537 RepID=A0A0E0LDY6_ORYPU
MEVDRVAAADGVHGLQQQPRRAAGTSSLLSSAVQEMLMVQKNNKAMKKPPRATPRLPPITGERRGLGSGSRSVERGETTEPAPKRVARVWQPLAKRVARSMLRRGAPPAPAPDEKRKVLTCCCARLPPGLRCALHQCAPGQSWMRSQRGGAIAAGDAVAPRACGRGGWLFSEYARWRRSVWMPSRFYLERVDGQPRPPPGGELTARRCRNVANVS